jgi:uncharacterized protein involved in exopolysaccharide biosynthesis
MERTFRPADYLSILKRRRIWFIIPFAVALLLGLALAVLLPTTYRSSATIAVQAPAVSPSFVGAPSAFDNEERLRALSQQLFSRTVLERVVREPARRRVGRSAEADRQNRARAEARHLRDRLPG